MGQPPVSYAAEKVHIQLGASTPYRGRYRAEPDVIPIHEQCFPIDHDRRLPTIQKSALMPAFSSIDLVPVSDEIFPVEKDIAPNISVMTSYNSSSVSVVSMSTTTREGATVPPGQELGSLTPSVVTCSTRFERKIRGAITFGWFESYGEHDISEPLVLPTARDHDLFVHHHGYGYGRFQLWIHSNGKWETVQCGHPHPSLPEHRLILKDKRPSWVTKQTVTTYAGRDRTSGKD
ncbi:hypothetical protein JOM56_013396 [Amanita muscaria]